LEPRAGEAVDFLLGRHRDSRVHDLVFSVVPEMVALAAVEPDLEAARRLARARLDDGSATERFAHLVRALGGSADFAEKAPAYLPTAPVIRSILPEVGGFVSGMDGRYRACAG
jgi:thymidine phosphorylase